ncbi:MAG: filamentous hemagglutinin family protein, partial [Verrucomicrobiales bacterium]
MRLENTACLLFWLLTSAAIAQAQIVADGSLGTRVSGPSNGIVISDGFRNGQNLFHSFDSFSVNVGEVASFAESLGVSRILARVTGPNRSEIQGILRAQSDLYLMNPNGVLFGEGATLEVNGLFVATTVDSIKLGESGEFSVSQRGDLSLLTFDAPEAFGFSGDRIAAPIEVTTLLSAQGSVTLVGGDILVRGGTAGLEIDSGDITLNAGGRVTLEGASPRASDKGSISTNGRVVIRAGELQMENFDISTGEGSPSMDIDIAGDMSMRPASTIRSKSGDIAVRAGGDMNLTVAQIMLEGSGSTLTVTAEGDLMLTGLGTSGNNPSLIQANVTGSESGADVTVNVRGDIRLEGRNTMIGVESSEGSSGTLGNVQVVADGNIDLSSRARISSEVNGSGGGGDLSVQAGGDILLDDRGSIIARSSEQSSGQLGSVSVEAADELVLSNRAEISALTQGSGKGGDIHVKAGGLLIDGGGLTTVIGEEVTPLATGILAKTFAPEGGGQGGNIDISIEGQAWLRNGGLIDSSTAGDGNGGAIFFRASDLSIDGRDQSGNNFMFSTGITAFTENLEIPNAGRGGDINVSLRQGGALQIFNGGQIDTSSFGGVGVAGNVSISFDQSQGSIFIDKGGAERFTGIGSDTSGNGNAGFVAVNTGTLSILNGGLISTGVFDSRNGQASTGNGGDITVTANTMLVKGASPPDPPDQQGGSVIGNSAIYAGTRTGTAGRSGTIHVI